MKAGGIDASRIESMLAQMRSAAQRPESLTSDKVSSGSAIASGKALSPSEGTGKLDFSEALKSSLNQVNQMQLESEKLGKNFVLGDDTVSLSDVMIAGQKANIAFQATVQVRNKLVAAYQDMMNMPV